MLIPISAYVQQADGNTVQVVVLDADARAALQALGVAGRRRHCAPKWAMTSAKPACSLPCVTWA